MDCSLPGFPVLHCLPVCSDPCLLSQWGYPLSSPSPPVLNLSQYRVFYSESALHMRWPVLELQFQNQSFQWISGLISFRTDWFALLAFQGFSRIFSNTTAQKINSLARSLFYCPALTSIHDYWKNHSFDWLYKPLYTKLRSCFSICFLGLSLPFSQGAGIF